VRILVAGLIVVGVAAGVAPGGANAAADVHVKWMNCVLHPGQLDIVYIENTGDAAQDLTGWELRSDGENERMSLTPAGTIDPGQEIFATAGAHAVNLPGEDVFLWSNDEMLRDSGDPPDYVRLLDAAGNQVSGMDCNHDPLAAPTAAPTAPPTAAPAPEPAVQVKPASSNPGAGSRPSNASGGSSAGAGSGPDSIPVGGGPPGMDGADAAGWLIAGAVLAAAGMAVTITAARKQRKPATAPAEGSSRKCGN
jgi:hypothetical protein